jgi:hypothetical protein
MAHKKVALAYCQWQYFLFVANKRTTNIMLHLKSYFAVFKECLSPDFPGPGGPTVIA